RLGFRAAVEQGRAFLRGRRRRGGEAYAGGRRRLAIAPDFAVAVVGRFLERDRRLERRKHQVPPAALGPRALAVGAAYDEPVDGARHGDVEQPPIFVLGLVPRALARRAYRRGVGRLLAGPREAAGRRGRGGRRRKRRRVARGGSRRRRRGIGENDDRRLQALGAVHRHHPHLVAGDLHVAFHVGLRRAQPGDE